MMAFTSQGGLRPMGILEMSMMYRPVQRARHWGCLPLPARLSYRR